jgi:hypothetical protein
VAALLLFQPIAVLIETQRLTPLSVQACKGNYFLTCGVNPGNLKVTLCGFIGSSPKLQQKILLGNSMRFTQRPQITWSWRAGLLYLELT